jgi:tetratricopeptide (TPR) repeat protein
MSPDLSSWTPAFVFLVVGAAIGGVLALLLRRRPGAEPRRPPVESSLEIRDLEQKEASLLAQLEELDDTAAKYRPDAFAARRRALEVEAAASLRALETSLAEARRREKGAVRENGRDDRATVPRAAATRGFLWGAGTVAALALLLVFVSRSATRRAPDGSLTGSVDRAGRTEVASSGEDDLQERIRSHPEDVEARLALARLQVARADWMGVWQQTQKILELAPDNAEALSYQGLVRFTMGQPDEAVTLLERAQAAAPDEMDSYAILSLVYAKTGRMSLAEATIKRAEERFPERRPMFEHMFDQLREQARAETGGTPPPAPVQGAGSGEVSRGSVAGVVELGDAAGAAAGAAAGRGAVLFVFARAAGSSGGPPVAVERLIPSSFPVAFSLDESNSMLGQPLPERMRLEARLDADGNPLTRSPADLRAELDDVAAGTRGLRLVLRP